MKKMRVVLVDDEIMIGKALRNCLTGKSTTAKWWARLQTAWKH